MAFNTGQVAHPEAGQNIARFLLMAECHYTSDEMDGLDLSDVENFFNLYPEYDKMRLKKMAVGVNKGLVGGDW